MKLPTFRYHPSPIETGSLVESREVCGVCGKSPGYMYEGPVFCPGQSPRVCPWCIADGSAHLKCSAEFTDSASLATVPRNVLEEVAFRTPGFTGWQQERWLTCCNDAAALVGIVGAEELVRLGPDAKAAAGRERELTGEALDRYASQLRSDGDLFVVMFRCLHCGKYLAYEDCS